MLFKLRKLVKNTRVHPRVIDVLNCDDHINSESEVHIIIPSAPCDYLIAGSICELFKNKR